MASASKTVQRIRNFLMGKEYNIALRYAADQQKRTQPEPNIPDGDAHLLSKNYYLTRDGRRNVKPAIIIKPTILQIAENTKKSGDQGALANMDEWEGNEFLPPHLFESPAEMRLMEFCLAAENGEIEKIDQMLNDRLVKSVNQQSPRKKETALHYAVRGGKLAVVKHLVEKGADVNLRDVRSKHSLQLACSGGYLDQVKYLLEQNASLLVVDKYGRSCLHWAATNKHYEIALSLIEAGAPIVYSVSNNWQPLHEAVKSGDARIAELLIEKGAPVNTERQAAKQHSFTPLHVAAREGNVDCLKLLLSCKALVNDVNQGKQTPLHEAAFKGSKECCYQLLLRGGDPHAKNNLERTPLLEACHNGHKDCAIVLLDSGSFVNRPDKSGDTALHHLLRYNSERMDAEKLALFVDVLLQYGANPMLKGREMDSAYSIANNMMQKDSFDVILTSMEKPRSLLHQAKIMCRRIVGCEYEKIKSLFIPKNLQVYLLQNHSYYVGCVVLGLAYAYTKPVHAFTRVFTCERSPMHRGC